MCLRYETLVAVSLAPAADQTLAILTLLSRQPEPLPAATIAAAISAPRSTTYRLLSVLVEHRFVSYLPEQRRYGLGVAAYELGSAYSRQMPLQRIARPVLARLVDQTRQNAHLATLDGRDVYYLIEERAAGRPSLVTEVGVRLPATLTASGLAMLAALPRRNCGRSFRRAPSCHSGRVVDRPAWPTCAGRWPRPGGAVMRWRRTW